MLLIMVCAVGRPPGFDRVRSAEIGHKDFNLGVLEEAYTTEHWLVRIYKVPEFWARTTSASPRVNKRRTNRVTAPSQSYLEYA